MEAMSFQLVVVVVSSSPLEQTAQTLPCRGRRGLAVVLQRMGESLLLLPPESQET